MSTHNIGLYEDLTKITFELSSNTHLITSTKKKIIFQFSFPMTAVKIQSTQKLSGGQGLYPVSNFYMQLVKGHFRPLCFVFVERPSKHLWSCSNDHPDCVELLTDTEMNKPCN